jgi:hypothetical protein
MKGTGIAVAAAVTAAALSLPIAFAADPAARLEPWELTALGLAEVAPVEPTEDRFRPPVLYFRSAEKLSAQDARKACADCADLIAVHAAETAVPPVWAVEPEQRLRTIGGRVQVREYQLDRRRVLIVTAASRATAEKILSALKTK